MTVLYEKQKELLEASINEPIHAFFWEPGCGKTLAAIKTAEHWYTEKGINTVIIVCGKTLIYGTWIKVELPKHSSVFYNTIGWQKSFNKSEQLIGTRKLAAPELLYIIVNPDAVASERFIKLYKYVEKRRKIGWIYDESTAIKDRKTDRCEYATKLSFSASYKRIMTGTPATEKPMDLFSQTQFLRPYLLGFRSYTAMKTRYCELKLRKFGNRAFTEIAGYRDLDDLHKRLLKFSSFLTLAEIKEIPEQSTRQVAIDLTDEQIKHYNDLKERAITYIQEHQVDAVNALALMRKLHQILVGQMKVAEKGYVSIKNNRLDVLEDLMNDTPDKVLIWSVYRHSTNDIVDRLGKRVVAIRAENTPEQREQIINLWRIDPEIQGLVLNQSNAAHGLTLNEAKTAIYYSSDFSLEKRLQSRRRNYRLGQDSKTVLIDLYVPNTLEEGILCAFEDKQQMADMITNKNNILSLIKGEMTLANRKFK